MKTRWFVLLVLVLVGAVIVQSRRSDADEVRKERPAAVSKTAYLNLSYVVKNYQKYKDFTAEMKKTMTQYEVRTKDMKSQSEALAHLLERPNLNMAERAELEKKAKQMVRDLEDLASEGKAFIGKKSDEQLVILYKEVTEVATTLAGKNGLDAVFHYNDATPDTPDFYSAPNVARKMQAGAVMPLYLRPELDISETVVKELNDHYKPKKGAWGRRNATDGVPGSAGSKEAGA